MNNDQGEIKNPELKNLVDEVEAEDNAEQVEQSKAEPVEPEHSAGDIKKAREAAHYFLAGFEKGIQFGAKEPRFYFHDDMYEGAENALSPVILKYSDGAPDWVSKWVTPFIPEIKAGLFMGSALVATKLALRELKESDESSSAPVDTPVTVEPGNLDGVFKDGKEP